MHGVSFLLYSISMQTNFSCSKLFPIHIVTSRYISLLYHIIEEKCLLHKSNWTFNECNTCNCASLNFCEYKYLVSLLRILACRGLCADCSQCLVTNKSNTVYFIIIEIFVKLDLPDTVTVDSIVFQDFFKKECTSSLLSSIWN